MPTPVLMLLPILSALSAAAIADDDGLEPGQRSPGDMSVAERVQMIQATNTYNDCVYQQATDKINSDADIRRIADNALHSCQPQLDGLQRLIAGWKFPAYFAKGYARTVRDHAARNILPELATHK